MKKFYPFLLGLLLLSAAVDRAQAQCIPLAVYIPSAFTDDATGGGVYNGPLCQGHDSLYTRTGWEYYDGDGYWFKMFAGSQITVTVPGCPNPVALNLVDSTGVNIVAGSFVSAACPQTLNFTAPYSGLYYLVFDTDNDCSTSSTNVEGPVSIKLNNAASVTNCTLFAANDTMCGATELVLFTPLNGNTVYAEDVDPRDADVTATLFSTNCSAPNNTLWYSFTPLATGTYDINTTSADVVGLDMWIGLFNASPCTGALNYETCVTGSFPTSGLITNTVTMNAGTTYYILIDGFSGATGAFTIELVPNTVGINERQLSAALSIYPNPATDILTMESKFHEDVVYTLVNPLGQETASGILPAGTTRLDISNQSSGMYFLRFQNSQTSVTKKIVIEHSQQ